MKTLCKKCGTCLKFWYKFCPECGAEISKPKEIKAEVKKYDAMDAYPWGSDIDPSGCGHWHKEETEDDDNYIDPSGCHW